MNKDGSGIVTLYVKNSPELQIILLGWSENVEVLELISQVTR